MKKKRWRFKAMIFAMIFSLLALSSCGKPKFEATYDWPMKEFSYINQDKKQVSLADLKGKVWLANFIFTNCETVCPPMTANMARLQQKMAEEKIDAQIVSFSVDPERDTPETLKEFANKFQADFSNWHFLTGYSEEETKELAKAFKTLAEAEPGTDQFFHSTKIFLINEDGIIVKGYNGLDVPYDEIISDLKALTK
ncbi:SCO family protein [Calidifontibacillus erzurumensis]|uniref:SCO family protein n=1 Tax=Calidifontibacillus erzurumensis TaxID=2741433 RepID=UPI0035B52C33